jgi:hypothetical protein
MDRKIWDLMVARVARIKRKAHLAETFRWSTETQVELVAMLSSGLGLAGPILAGAVAGHPTLGLVGSAGSLMVGRIGRKPLASPQMRDLAAVLAAGLAAWIAGALIADRGALTNSLVVLLAAGAAVFSGCSRLTAVATTRFIFALIITVGLMGVTPHRIGLVALMIAGGLWTALLTLLLGAAVRAVDGIRRLSPPPDTVEAPSYSAKQMRIRWKSSLGQLGGWQYPLRLTVCLAIAECIASLWPGHHAQWIPLTVVLLTRRVLEATPVRTTQRALGTVLGVMVASVLLAWHPPVWGIAILVGPLGGVRPLLRARNYLLYSLVMTPLILLMLDAGRAADLGVLFDRVLATLIGSGLVLSAGMVVSHLTAKPGADNKTFTLRT